MTDRRIELLAPAGNWDCARAAVANGADAVYFGMPRFNARLRADNFQAADLKPLMEFLHSHGVRGFVAFNTLIFSSELEAAAGQLRLLEEAGVDAVIVQDLGLAAMTRALTPRLDLHASTQMTITSPEGLDFIRELFDIERAVIARENSMREIRLYRPETANAVELEVFVHGALCVAYSGQCLTSESLGQRSANRGECAQACRMPYEMIVDGEVMPLGDEKYLLSPQDLAGIDQIPDLITLGVSSFKIEGRLKTPEYVAGVTRTYRKAIDAALAGAPGKASEEDRYALEMTFSRGLSSGWLEGADHQKLVEGRYGKKRGAFVGRIEAIGGDWIELTPLVSLKNGDGIVFDTGGDTEHEQGGRIYEIEGARIRLARGKIDFRRLQVGDRVWKTDDPALDSALRSTFQRENLPMRKHSIYWSVSGDAGEPLLLRDRDSKIEIKSEVVLVTAQNRPLSEEILRQQLGRLGGTVYELGGLEVDLPEAVMLPLGELNRLRRAMVEAMEERRLAPYRDRIQAPKAVTTLVDLLPERSETESELSPPELRVLCRTDEQVEAALACGVSTIYADYEDPRRFRNLVAEVRERSSETRLLLATPRIQKAGEVGLFRIIDQANPDGVLVRNLGAIPHFRHRPGLVTVGDFSLNVANPISARLLMDQGFENLTVSYDLNIEQVLDLLDTAPPEWFEITIHQHMPMFHMEHCVFCRFLSTGKDFRDCGRPCEKHVVHLRDRVGQLHRLSADVGCRNTLFNGRAQSGARYFSALRDAGLRRYRIELLDEGKDDAKETIRLYQDLLSGGDQEEQILSRLRTVSRLGIVEGTLEARKG